MAKENIPGWAEVLEWFGYSPSFHDAEIIALDLRRDPEPSLLRVHAWRTNNDTDEKGVFRQDRHAVVTFALSGITSMELKDWNHQNVLMELSIDAGDEGQTLHLPSAYGAEGQITAESISVSVEPLRS